MAKHDRDCSFVNSAQTEKLSYSWHLKEDTVSSLRQSDAAGAAQTVAVQGDDAINAVQELPRSGQAAEKPKRPGPPDAPGDFHDGVGPAEIPAISQQQARFAKAGAAAQAEALGRALRLQSAKLESPSGQNSLDAACRLTAHAAVAVVKQPAGNGIRYICYFCIHRNCFPKKDRQPPMPSSLRILSPALTNLVSAPVGH